MIWRFSILFMALALIIGVLFYFSDGVFNFIQQYWALDKGGREQWLDTAKLIATVLAILGAIGGFISFIMSWVAGKKEDKYQQDKAMRESTVVGGNYAHDNSVGGNLSMGGVMGEAGRSGGSD